MPVERRLEALADVLDERLEVGRGRDGLVRGGGHHPPLLGVGFGVGECAGEGARRGGRVAVLEGAELGGLTLRQVGYALAGVCHNNPLSSFNSKVILRSSL
ncbi:hypothetical protein SGPA1_80138 [Streptomyces misionensis JCM 4497]